MSRRTKVNLNIIKLKDVSHTHILDHHRTPCERKIYKNKKCRIRALKRAFSSLANRMTNIMYIMYKISFISKKKLAKAIRPVLFKAENLTA